MESDSPSGMHEGLASPGGVFVREEGEVAPENIMGTLLDELFFAFTRWFWTENPFLIWLLGMPDNEGTFSVEDELAEVFCVPYGP